MTLFTATHLLDEVAEAKLMPFLRQPLKDILVMVRDTGMRNISEVWRMRIEHIDWHNCVIFHPKGETPEARRSVPMRRSVWKLRPGYALIQRTVKLIRKVSRKHLTRYQSNENAFCWLGIKVLKEDSHARIAAYMRKHSFRFPGYNS